jgi:HAD superfamily hydrolase (TIGR01662 family)
MKIRAALVDMGGVLIDFDGGRGLPVGHADWRGREALLHYLRRRGAKLDMDDLESLFFSPWFREYRRREDVGREADWDPHLRRLRKRAGVKTHSIVLLGRWFRPFAEQLQPLPGVEKSLRRMYEKGIRLALVSNVPLPGRLYRDLLRRRRLARYFESLHFSYDEGSRKPSPAMLRSALRGLDVPPHEAIMVGDRRAVDIAAGRAAGTATAWVRSEDGGGPDADIGIDSLVELPDLLESMGA